MKILVIGGMHGNEPLGIELVKLFKLKPVNNIDSIIANPVAVEQNVRFVNQDLNRCFPGSKSEKSYEQSRAAELVALCKKYDLVLDFHNTHCPQNDCAFVGNNARNNLYDISSSLGLNKVIVANYDCLNKAASNCLSVEVSLSSSLNKTQLWYDKIVQLSKAENILANKPVERYTFVYRMSLSDKQVLRLDKENLQAFVPLRPYLAQKLGVDSPAYPIFINDAYTPYNYGGLLNKRN